ncbi:hypothetical protein [Catelliglobosispora koreensis]|uniref:hypothetical protein n=1 Tax=Catelliglobosispora koreensis TaxID=129052 RepID=UPI000370A4EF|nr:hypothetical protein [Catelliglobosispora koreensis]
MTEHPRHLDRETAERLLSGASSTAHPELSALLSSAAGPALPGELAGESAAVAAFLAARRNPMQRPHRLRRMLVLKVSAVVALVTAGGLAFASGTGIIPSPFRPTPVPTVSSPVPSVHPSAGSVTPSAAPSASDEAAEMVKGLCHAYLAKSSEDRAKALESPAFERLVAAAGGANQVDAYCAALPDKPKPEKSHTPGNDGQVPGGRPSAPPSNAKR